MAYLCNQYAPDTQLYPSDPQQRAVIDKWLQFDLGSLYKSICDYTVSSGHINWSNAIRGVAVLTYLVIIIARSNGLDAHFQ